MKLKSKLKGLRRNLEHENLSKKTHQSKVLQIQLCFVTKLFKASIC